MTELSSKKRFLPVEELPKPRYEFLLIINGDSTSYYSCPINLVSVRKIKDAIKTYREFTPANNPDAGVGLLALALARRIDGKKTDRCVLNARTYFARVTVGGKPAMVDSDPDFTIDANELITEVEWEFWKSHSEWDFGPVDECKTMYEVVVLRDCC